MSPAESQRKITDELTRLGVAYRIERGTKHPRIYFATPEGEKFHVLPGSPTGPEALQHALGDIRRMLGITNRRRKSNREKKYQPEHEVEPPIPDSLTPGPDWKAPLVKLRRQMTEETD